MTFRLKFICHPISKQSNKFPLPSKLKFRGYQTVNYAGSFRIVCGIHCVSSQLGPDSVCSLGPLSSKCLWCTLCHRRMYPSTNDTTKYALTHSKSIDFVIPDSCLSTSIQVLTHLDNLAPCPDLKVSPASSRLRQTPPPTFHAHIEDLEVTVSLYSQSETLWFLLPLDWSLASPKEVELPSFFVFASDQTVLPPWRPGRGSGFFKPGQYPVIIPKSHVLLEAFMFLYARDWDKRIGDFSTPPNRRCTIGRRPFRTARFYSLRRSHTLSC
jgi:hypothetical protein